MKKIKLETDKKAVNEALNDIKALYNRINVFAEEVIETGVVFTSEFFVSYINEGESFVQEVYDRKFEEDYARLQISNPVFKSTIMKGKDDIVQKVMSYHTEMQNSLHKCQLTPEKVAFKDSRPTITELDKKEVNERCSAYLNTEIDKRIYDTLKEFCSAFEKTNKVLIENGLPELEAQLSTNEFGYFNDQVGFEVNPWLFSGPGYLYRVDPEQRQYFKNLMNG